METLTSSAVILVRLLRLFILFFIGVKKRKGESKMGTRLLKLMV